MSEPAGHVATASVVIAAPPQEVWDALVAPDAQYMFGSDIVTDWTAGSPILFRGRWEGKPFEDTGTILAVDPPRRLRYSHYSPLSGAPDVPESYHRLTFTLDAVPAVPPVPAGTRLSLTQDNNETPQAAEHASGMWRDMLDTLRESIEQG